MWFDVNNIQHQGEIIKGQIGELKVQVGKVNTRVNNIQRTPTRNNKDQVGEVKEQLMKQFSELHEIQVQVGTLMKQPSDKKQSTGLIPCCKIFLIRL